MERKEAVRRYSADELRAMRAQGESRTDFQAADAKTEEELEADIASDPEFANQPEDWYKNAEAVMPKQKAMLTLRLDQDVVNWFRARGPGYQTRMNAVLKAFMMHEENVKRRA